MIWMILCLVLMNSIVFAQPVDLPPLDAASSFTYDELKLLDPLPDYVYMMDRETYVKWATAQNNGAYDNAKKLAEGFEKMNPYNPTYVSTTRGSISTDAGVGYVSRTVDGINNYYADTYYSETRNARFYERTRWGGGCVLVINPYAKRPPKKITTDRRVYLADPDGVIKNIEDAKKFLEGN